MTQKQKVSIGFDIFIFILLLVVLAFFIWKQQEEVITSIIPPQESYFADWNVYEHNISTFSETPSFNIYYPKDWAITIDYSKDNFYGLIFRPKIYLFNPDDPSTYEHLEKRFFLKLVDRDPNVDLNYFPSDIVTNISPSRASILKTAEIFCSSDGPLSSTFCPPIFFKKIIEFQNGLGVTALKIERKFIISYLDGTKEERDDFAIAYEFPESFSEKYAGIVFNTYNPEYLDIMLSIANTLRF